MKYNRPYAHFVEEGVLLGTSLAEFETCLWQHIAIKADRIDLDFVYQIKEGLTTATLSTRK
jgi:hypothetical protein